MNSSRLWMQIGCALFLSKTSLAAGPLPTTTYAVDGPSKPIEILVDRWGIPHIYAGALYDVFFGQGFNAARDRLWQLDLWKRRGDGTLSEAFGPAFVEKDRAARLFLYRGEMRAEWLAYGSDAKRIVTAFVDGINTYIELSAERPELLPMEFKTVAYKPARWTPETVVRIRSHGLRQNVSREADRAGFLRQHGRAALALVDFLQPPHEVEVPDGLDLGAIPDEVLKVYDLATSPASFSKETGKKPAAVYEARPRQPSVGSNNWAVAGSRSATGRPILANDPHRGLRVPSLRYLAHLSAPGLDVIGAGEPALPGISIGHNERVAFGLTIFAIDQEDLYVYDTNPSEPAEYRYRDRWEPMRLVRETIPVRDAPPVEVELRFTRHGPVVYEDRDRHRAFAVRAGWLEPGMAPYLASIEYMRARDWDQFLAAMNRWGAPSENQVYADVDGNIGWKPGGLAPIRPNWDGLLPVPGDGRYEWAGFRTMDELPVEYNPERGWVATANQMNLPSGYPHQLAYEWALPYRYQRISEVLGRSGRLGLDGMLNLQTDYASLPARRLLALLGALRARDARLRKAIDLLSSWDAVLGSDDAAAALFEIWYGRHLGQALVARLVDSPAARKDLGGGNPEVRISLLEKPAGRFDRGELLLSSLAAAVDDAEKLLGRDWRRWSWGRLHRAAMEHPLAPLVDEKTRMLLNVGPLPRGGDDDTVGNTSYRPTDFLQTGGASFRMIVDVGNWDATLAMNSPGQSGDPASPHYKDLFPHWAKDEAFPLLYSRDRVMDAAQQRIVLEPRR